MTQSTEKDRAEFEAWWQEWGLGGYDVQFEAWQAARRAQVVPQGWKLVPVVPTEEMLDAIDLLCDDLEAFEDSQAFWNYLIEAAPQPPALQFDRVEHYMLVQGSVPVPKPISQPLDPLIDAAPQPPNAEPEMLLSGALRAAYREAQDEIQTKSCIPEIQTTGCKEQDAALLQHLNGTQFSFEAMQARWAAPVQLTELQTITCALKRCARVLAGEDMSKAALVSALELARDALQKVEALNACGLSVSDSNDAQNQTEQALAAPKKENNAGGAQ